MGEHAQLDLRVVRRQQHRPRIRNEGAADAASLRGAGRYVLQIGVRGAQPPGGGQGLMERRMEPAGARVDRRRQRVDVGGLELGDSPVLQQPARQFVGRRQLGQDVDVGRVSAFGLLESLGGQLELVKQHLAQLIGRVQVEFAAGQLEALRLQAAELDAEFRAHRLQRRRIDQDAGRFHVGQHRRPAASRRPGTAPQVRRAPAADPSPRVAPPPLRVRSRSRRRPAAPDARGTGLRASAPARPGLIRKPASIVSKSTPSRLTSNAASAVRWALRSWHARGGAGRPRAAA